MAKQAPTEANQQTAKKPRILKFGMLASGCTVPISGPVTIGNYGKYDVPFTLDGQRFVLPVSPQNPEWTALQVAFGDDPATWAGNSIRVSDGTMIRNVRIVPVATRDGKPVA